MDCYSSRRISDCLPCDELYEDEAGVVGPTRKGRECSRSKERHPSGQTKKNRSTLIASPVATTRRAIHVCGQGSKMIFPFFGATGYLILHLYLSPPPRGVSAWLVISRRAPRDMFAASIVAHAGTAVAARGECDAPAPSPPTNPFAVPRLIRAEGAPPKGYGNEMDIHRLFNFPRRG